MNMKMVYRKRAQYGRKRFARRKRTFKRKRTMRRRRVNRNLHKFKRTSFAASIVLDATQAQNIQNISFKLSQLPQVTDITQLCDQYRIDGIKVTWIPGMNFTTSLGIGDDYSNSLLIGCKCNDYDSSNIATLDGIRQYANSRLFNPAKPHSWFIKPSVLVPLYQTGATYAYGPRWKQWIDCNNADVPHYGMAIGVAAKPALSDGIRLNVTLEYTFYLSARGVR